MNASTARGVLIRTVSRARRSGRSCGVRGMGTRVPAGWRGVAHCACSLSSSSAMSMVFGTSLAEVVLGGRAQLQRSPSHSEVRILASRSALARWRMTARMSRSLFLSRPQWWMCVLANFALAGTSAWTRGWYYSLGPTLS